MTFKSFLLILLLGIVSITPTSAAQKRVTTSDELIRAARSARPGDDILLAPGEYRPNIYLDNLRGTAAKPILIRAEDPHRRPRFSGGTESLHLSDVAYVELRDLILTGASGNGLNIDDAGTFETPSHHVTLRNLSVSNVGPSGNRDGIKLSGVDDFKVVNCDIESWGDAGSGIDMVGCHRGLIQGCRFRRGGNNAVQTKGGTTDVTVRGCRFQDAGQRAIHIGGSTDLAVFRPRVQGFEAKNIRVEHNVISGSDAPIVFVGVDGAVVRRNTIYRPRRWVIRILQETTEPGFVPCRNGRFIENVIVWRAGELISTVNIGPNTAPETFRFARNAWYCLGNPQRSRPDLPTPEQKGMIGRDPMLRDPEHGDFRLKAGSPAKGKGA